MPEHEFNQDMNSNKSKVIYLSYLPITKKLEHDFYVDALVNSGIPAEYWDLSKLYFPEIQFKEVARDYVKKADDYDELIELIQTQDISRCVFVIMVTYNARTVRLFRILKTYNCFSVFFARCGIPVNAHKKSLYEIFQSCLNVGKIKNKISNELSNLINNCGITKIFDLVFAAGSLENSNYRGSNLIPINHFDYDNFLTLKDNSSRNVKEDYCVFLVDNLAYDTDLQLSNLKSVTPHLYFSSLCFFFNELEERCKIKVIIAAHPKSKYQGNEFGNREIFYDSTNALAKDCRFAIAHYSTSISFPILYEKPIIFIFTNEMKNLFYFRNIKTFSNELNSRMVNIDEKIYWGNLNFLDLLPDRQRYKDYKFKYLTTESTENQLSRDIYVSQIKNMTNTIHK